MDEVNDDDIDKIFLQMRKELQKIKPETGGQDYGPKERSGFHTLGFGINIPDGFEKAGREKTAAIFFSKNRPDIVLLNPAEHAGITFQTAKSGNFSLDLEVERKQIRRILSQADAKNVFYDQGNVFGDIPVVWFDYKSFAVDERVYNMMFLFPASEKLMIGTFYCIFKDYDRWRPEILNMLRTIRTEEAVYERI
ncbi:hypothetical protein [Lacrimispora sp.]|uniref:hypothetical protein n=1 Tax=Lacrimispora sp. TaxID=2719234 RepID=UPI0028574F03|nr:hypothetical protein [Lacrimispora sp.]MDR7810480.1 hypothetical protein [Lacrimispora sp.]